MTCFKSYFLPALLLLPLLFTGCGYRIGARSLMHPQVKSIAVAEIKNDTLEMLAASIMRQQLCERFQFDGGLTLKNIGSSDCILYGKITSITNRTIREDSMNNDVTYRPAEFQITVTLEYSVLIPGRGAPLGPKGRNVVLDKKFGAPLIPKRTVSGSANYQILADPAISRTNALKQACYNTAKLAVEYTTEAW